MSKQIKIACEGAALLPIEQLEIMQGDLKSLSKENYEKLKRAIEKHGFTAPIFVWRGENKILDGTQRLRTVQQMLTEGWQVNGGKLPVCWIEAENLKQAKEILLTFVSQYGKLENDGQAFYEYLMTNEPLDFEEVKLEIDLPDFNLPRFERGFFDKDISPNRIDKKGLQYGAECYIEIYCTCLDLKEFQPILDEWMQKDGVGINISNEE